MPPTSNIRKSALVLGATGGTGKHVLQELLQNPEISRVCEAGRRLTPMDDMDSKSKSKLTQKVVDFENIKEAGLGSENWDIIYVALGTTKAAAGSAAAFEKIDREYVVNAAEAARSTSGNKQTIVYVSSGGASATSPFLYPKSKGLTEQGLARLRYDDTIIFRPGLLLGRQEKRFVESAISWVTGLMTYIGNDYEIPMPILGKAVVRAGLLGSSNLPENAFAKNVDVESGVKFTLVDNRGASNIGTAA